MSYIRFRKNDIEWKNIPYPKSSQTHTIGNAGCGPVCVAIIVSDIIPTITPAQTAKYLSKHGYGTMGTSWRGIYISLRHYGYSETNWHSKYNCYNKTETIAELNWRNNMQNGYVGILNMGPSIWTEKGCYIAITDAKFENGIEYYYVIDPEGEYDGWFSWKDFSGKVKNFFSIPSRKSLDIDGQWGTETTTFLQRVLGTREDGIISEQDERLQEFVPAGSENTFSWIKHPVEKSEVISKLQEMLNVPVDGNFGITTIEALQKMLNIKVTGFCDLITVKALQQWINTKIKKRGEQ